MMRKCVIDQKTNMCINVILLGDDETFAPSNENHILSPRHDGEIGWQLTAGEWVYDVPKTPELTEEQLAAIVRNKRNALLAASDWTQVADSPVNQAAWAAYRQALRDITSQTGFPQTVDWPTAP